MEMVGPFSLVSQVPGTLLMHPVYDTDSEREINKVVAEYAAALTKMKEKFPNTKVVVAGLPPCHPRMKFEPKPKTIMNL